MENGIYIPHDPIHYSHYPHPLLPPLLLLLPLSSAILLCKHGLLRTPKLTIQPVPIDQLLMRTLLRNPTSLQHDNDVGVVDRAQTVRDEDGCAFLLAHQRVDVREESLLGVCVEGGCLGELVWGFKWGKG